MNSKAYKRRARALQDRTGWKYQQCLRVLELRMPDEALEQLILIIGVEQPTVQKGS